MNYNVMSKELIDINKIKNLEYISFYDFTVPRKDSNDGRRVIAPALMVKADGKTFNYSVMDKCFVQYVHKVISVYNKESKMDLDDEAVPTLMTERIVIDDKSKAILEKASFLEGKEITGFYDGKDGYDDTLIFQIDEIKSIMDIIRYVITDFSKSSDINIKLSSNYSGYHDYYCIDSEIDGIYTNLSIYYEKLNENEYRVSIGNLGEPCRPYVVDIHFMDNRISIVGKYKDTVIANEFKIDENGATHLNYAYRDGKQIAYEVVDLEEVDFNHKNLINLDRDNEFTWYKLPWNAYIGRNSSVNEVDPTTQVHTNQVMYLDMIDDNFYKREFYTKKLLREKTATQSRFILTVDELRKITFGFKLDDDNYLVETSFKKALGDGEYQEKYNNRYFYHLAHTQSLEGITREDLIPITKDIIEDRNDLLREEKVKRIGEKK